MSVPADTHVPLEIDNCLGCDAYSTDRVERQPQVDVPQLHTTTTTGCALSRCIVCRALPPPLIEGIVVSVRSQPRRNLNTVGALCIRRSLRLAALDDAGVSAVVVRATSPAPALWCARLAFGPAVQPSPSAVGVHEHRFLLRTLHIVYHEPIRPPLYVVVRASGAVRGSSSGVALDKPPLPGLAHTATHGPVCACLFVLDACWLGCPRWLQAPQVGEEQAVLHPTTSCNGFVYCTTTYMLPTADTLVPPVHGAPHGGRSHSR